MSMFSATSEPKASTAAQTSVDWSPRVAVSIGVITFVAMLPVTMLVAPLKELITVRFEAGSFWTHSFMSINMLGAILAAPLIAMLSDRPEQRRRVAMLALSADAICLAGMAVVPSLAGLLVLRFFEGAAHILALTTLLAIGASWAPENRRGRMMGVIGACMMFGTACGTRLGGLVWKSLESESSVFIIAGSFSIFAAMCVLGFVSEPKSAKPGRSRFKDTLSALSENPKLIVPLVYALIDRLCVGVVISTFVLFLGDVHGMDPDSRGTTLFLFLFPFALCVYPAGRLVDRIGRIYPIAFGSIAFGLVFATYGILTPMQLKVAMVISGLLSAMMFAPNLALCADMAPPQLRGAVFTGFNTAGSLGFVLGPLFAGAAFSLLTNWWPTTQAYQITFLGAGAVEVLCAAITLPMLLKLKRQGSLT